MPPAGLGKDGMISKGVAPSGPSGKCSFPVHSSRVFDSYLRGVPLFKTGFVVVLQQKAQICSSVLSDAQG